LAQPVALGRLSGTGLVGASRCRDEENARALRRMVVPGLRLANALPGLEPLDGQLLIRIREPGTRLPSAGALPILGIVLPRHRDDASQLVAHTVERRVIEALPQPPLEFLAGQLRTRLLLAHRGCWWFCLVAGQDATL